MDLSEKAKGVNSVPKGTFMPSLFHILSDDLNLYLLYLFCIMN